MRKKPNNIWKLSYALDKDPLLKQELDMRMMSSEVAPWIASLEDNPSVLPVPTVFFEPNLMRTVMQRGVSVAQIFPFTKLAANTAGSSKAKT